MSVVGETFPDRTPLPQPQGLDGRGNAWFQLQPMPDVATLPLRDGIPYLYTPDYPAGFHECALVQVTSAKDLPADGLEDLEAKPQAYYTSLVEAVANFAILGPKMRLNIPGIETVQRIDRKARSHKRAIRWLQELAILGGKKRSELFNQTPFVQDPNATLLYDRTASQLEQTFEN